MAWDPSRPVPWARLIKEWAIYAGIMAVVFVVLFRDRGNVIGILAGLLASGPLYLGIGYVLAKFGYQRKTLAELRTPRATATTSSPTVDHRPRPTPTRRTSGGGGRRPATGASRKRR